MPAAAARRLPHQGAGPTPSPGWRRPRHTRCSRPASRGRGLGPALFPRLRPPPPPGAFRSSRAPCCGRRPGARPPSRGRGAWGGRSAGHTPRARPAGPRGTPRQILPPPPSRTQLRSGAASGSDSGLPAVLRGQPRGGCSGSGADGTRCLPPGLPAPPFPRPWRSPTHPQAPPVSAPLTPSLGGCAGSSVHSHAGQATAGCVQKPPEKEAMGQLGSWHLRAEAWLTCWMGIARRASPSCSCCHTVLGRWHPGKRHWARLMTCSKGGLSSCGAGLLVWSAQWCLAGNTLASCTLAGWPACGSAELGSPSHALGWSLAPSQ